MIIATQTDAFATGNPRMEKDRPESRRRSIKKARSRRSFRKARCHPCVEFLESRLVLSRFKVNTLLDTVAVDLKTGKDSSGHISLRSAIQAANSKPNADTIVLPS